MKKEIQILVVEDDNDINKLVCDILKKVDILHNLLILEQRQCFI